MSFFEVSSGGRLGLMSLSPSRISALSNHSSVNSGAVSGSSAICRAISSSVVASSFAKLLRITGLLSGIGFPHRNNPPAFLTHSSWIGNPYQHNHPIGQQSNGHEADLGIIETLIFEHDCRAGKDHYRISKS